MDKLDTYLISYLIITMVIVYYQAENSRRLQWTGNLTRMEESGNEYRLVVGKYHR
jgi:hypothetical protein